MNILGISCYYHDAAAALLCDGELVAVVAEERLSRRKHDAGFPVHAIRHCLREARLKPEQADLVVFYEKPFLKYHRLLNSYLRYFPRSWPALTEALHRFFSNKMWIRQTIARRLKISPKRVLFVPHHLSHAASAFFASPFDEAAIVTLDGVGEWATGAIAHGSSSAAQDGQNSIRMLREMCYPDSLGLLYSVFTAYLGFEVNEGEYKVMGMAPYGQPRYLDEIQKVIEIYPDGSIRLIPKYFSFMYSSQKTFTDKFIDLFGPARVPESEFFTVQTHPRHDHPEWSDQAAAENQRFSDVAASIQKVTEEIVLAVVREAHRLTGSKNLVMAGGVALNSVANGRVAAESPYEGFFIQPDPGDAGGALGAALAVEHLHLGRRRRFRQTHAYWGPEYSREQMLRAIKMTGLPFDELAGQNEIVEQAAQALAQGKVIGWFQGRSEWGPRALGHRSILADPRPFAMKEIVNTKIKFREPFRPFAPSILEEDMHEYFILPRGPELHVLDYMQMVAKFCPGQGEKVAAVCHNDYTGRLQRVRRDSNPLYHQLISRFKELTGIPVLLNTSFNLRGEPMVDSPEDALNTFSKSHLDLLFMGNFIVAKAMALKMDGLDLFELSKVV